MEDYNYTVFKAEYYDFSLNDGLQIGDKFADGQLTTLDGKTVKLSDYLDKPLVLETGSLTCPIYKSQVDPMNAIAEKYPQFNFAVMYVREAHPGSKRPAHESFEDKMNYAKQTVDEYPENRLVLIDDIEGTLHKQYQALPNAVFIIDSDGIIRYVAKWNSPKSTAKMLDQMIEGKIETYHPPEFLPGNPLQAINVMRRSGWDAVRDFIPGLPRLVWSRMKMRKNWSRDKTVDNSRGQIQVNAV